MTTETQWVVPMYESERGWGSKVDGYAGPFASLGEAELFRERFNKKYNSAIRAPDHYIAAMYPREFTGQQCDYKSTVD